MVENIDIMTMINKTVVNENIGDLKARTLSMGSFNFSCLITNTASDTNPVMIDRYT